MSNLKAIILMELVCLAVCGLALAGSAPDPNLYPDLNGDDIINFTDFAMMASNWQKTGIGLTGDFDNNQKVDYNDLFILAYRWLEGSRPQTVFAQFKAALAVSDVNKALTFIAEVPRDEYASIFQIIGTKLPDYAAGMGNLIFDSEEVGKEKYEMQHQVGSATYLFSVIFIKDENGSWQIYNF